MNFHNSNDNNDNEYLNEYLTLTGGVLVTQNPFESSPLIDFHNESIMIMFKEFVIGLSDTIEDLGELSKQYKDVKKFNRDVELIIIKEFLEFTAYIVDDLKIRMSITEIDTITEGLKRLYRYLIGVGDVTLNINDKLYPKFHYLRIIFLYNALINIEDSFTGGKNNE